MIFSGFSIDSCLASSLPPFFRIHAMAFALLGTRWRLPSQNLRSLQLPSSHISDEGSYVPQILFDRVFTHLSFNQIFFICLKAVQTIVHRVPPIMPSCFSDNIKQNPRKVGTSIIPLFPYLHTEMLSCLMISCLVFLCNNNLLHTYSIFIFCTVDFVWFSLFLSCSTF